MGIPPVETGDRDEPLLAFGGPRPKEDKPGPSHIYWRLTTAALQRMMEYAGFARTEPHGSFSGSGRAAVIGHVR
jgi:hypothetical protein